MIDSHDDSHDAESSLPVDTVTIGFATYSHIVRDGHANLAIDIALVKAGDAGVTCEVPTHPGQDREEVEAVATIVCAVHGQRMLRPRWVRNPTQDFQGERSLFRYDAVPCRTREEAKEHLYPILRNYFYIRQFELQIPNLLEVVRHDFADAIDAPTDASG